MRRRLSLQRETLNNTGKQNGVQFLDASQSPKKKMSNCIIRAHPHLSANERAVLLKKAKIATARDQKPSVVTKALTIKQAFKKTIQKSTTDINRPKVITPSYVQRLGKTHHYPRFCIASTHILASFQKYHQTIIDGGRKGESEDKQTCEDVSKYLYFANPEQVYQGMIMNAEKLDLYP